MVPAAAHVTLLGKWELTVSKAFSVLSCYLSTASRSSTRAHMLCGGHWLLGILLATPIVLLCLAVCTVA